jgi:hypothetical protein
LNEKKRSNLFKQGNQAACCSGSVVYLQPWGSRSGSVKETDKVAVLLMLETWGESVQGYPNSVTPDYLPFQMWDTLQGLSTYIRSMLSTQALLGGIGVGETTATVVGATFQVSNELSQKLSGLMVLSMIN